MADNEGRFKWESRKLKVQILPYEACDFELILDELCTGGFIAKYENDKQIYGLIPTFTTHQKIHPKAAKSKLPSFYSELSNVIKCNAIKLPLELNRIELNRIERKGKEAANASSNFPAEKSLVPYQAILDIYTINLPANPKPRLTDSLKEKIATMYNRHEKDLDSLGEAFRLAGERPFFSGDNDRGWIQGIRWFLEPKNEDKIFDGLGLHAEKEVYTKTDSYSTGKAIEITPDELAKLREQHKRERK